MPHDETKPDWIHLPPFSDPVSLWKSLHDGELLRVHSDLLERTVVLEIDVSHMRSFHSLREETRFLLTLHDVESARVTAFMVWPGERPEMAGKLPEEQTLLVAEYQAKWREESVGWNDFVSAFPTNTLDIYTAELAQSEHITTLQLTGSLDGDEIEDRYTTVSLRAGKLTVRQSDGLVLTLEQFIKLGEDYWEALIAKAPTG
jgi:hypothetical protein